MLPMPHRYTLVAGFGEASSLLNAFDVALLNAGIGNLNLLKVSSILPPASVLVSQLSIEPGTLVPTAYATLTSQTRGQVIAAAVAVGVPDGDGYGVIMECSGYCHAEELEKKIREMVSEAFSVRQIPLKEIKVVTAEHRVINCGSVFAGVALW